MNRSREEKIAIDVGQAIARRRVEVGLTQEALAEKLSVGYESVSRMECGIRIPSITRLIEVAEILKCDASYFIHQGSDSLEDQAQYANSLLNNIKPKDREFLLQQLKVWVTRLAQK